MKKHHSLAVALVVVGALNWGLVGLVGFNLVSTLFGANSILERVVYVLVGLSGIWLVWNNWMVTPAKTKAKGKR